MRVLGSGDRVPAETRCAVAVGNFDGLHRGHTWLLRKLRQYARTQNLATAVVTFDPHPLQVLRPVSAPKLLTDMALRLQRLQASGLVDVCAVVPFDYERSLQSPEEFVAEVLVDQLQARQVMIGTNFRFGQGRTGDAHTLRSLGDRHDFAVTAVPLVTAGPGPDARTCCSTYVRRLVAEGYVERAALYLDRQHEVSGQVVATSWPAPGRGTPIVVVRISADRALPIEGSFAGTVLAVDGRERPAGISIRPGAIAGQDPLLDLHVVDRVQDLMDQTVVVRFQRRMWSSTPSELLQQVDQQATIAGHASASGGWGAVV